MKNAVNDTSLYHNDLSCVEALTFNFFITTKDQIVSTISLYLQFDGTPMLRSKCHKCLPFFYLTQLIVERLLKVLLQNVHAFYLPMFCKCKCQTVIIYRDQRK